jgi:hypothetical protein
MVVTLFFPPSPQRVAVEVLGITMDLMADQEEVVDITQLLPMVGQAQLVKEMMEVVDIFGVEQ